MKIKKCIASVIAAAFCLTMITETASAHTDDVFEGKYIGKDRADFVLRINSSAQNDVFNYSDVYKYGTDWNATSSMVNLSVVMAGGFTPTILNELNVDGANLPISADGMIAGYTLFYDVYGEPINENCDCAFSRIQINTSNEALDYFRTSTRGKLYAKTTFLHEVGHVLKLAHPIQDPTQSGHTLNGYPKAIMNPGKAGYYGYIGVKIEDHDTLCVQAKWEA